MEPLQNNEKDSGSPLLAPLSAAIELALNQYLALDPESRDSLKQLSGKIIKLQLTAPAFELFLLPAESGIQVLNHYQDSADTTIKGSLSAFANLGLANDKEKNTAVFSGQISIEGDIALGQKFQALFENLDIDWEEHLSHIVGDVVAHKMGSLGRRFFAWGQQSKESLALDSTEFLQYETRDLLEGREMTDFLKQVDTIRSDVDRLEARINRLFNLHNQNHSK